MLAHTNEFKNTISKIGREIDCKLLFHIPPNLITEDNNYLITEDGKKIELENDNIEGYEDLTTITITNESIYSIDFIKNGNILQTLMKQCNIEIKQSFNIGETFNLYFGVKINNSYEYLNFGKFIIYSKSFNADNTTWKYVCYDEMLWTMKKYTKLNISYPITVANYINAIAEKIGVTFYNHYKQFVNRTELIQKDYFAGKNVTYRDILDKLAELTASNILIKNGQLYVKYPIETNDILTEDNLKDVNIDFGEMFTPIDKINLIDTNNNMQYTYTDNTIIDAYGVNQINIINNPFILNGNKEEICQNLLEELGSLYYSLNDFTTTGVCYYEYLDLFNVQAKGKTYNCLLLNNEIKITQGIEENIFTEKLENTQSENDTYQNISSSQNEINEINQEKVNKNNIINTINLSNETNIIATNKIMLIKNITATTDANGFLDIGLNKDYIVCSAIAGFSGNDYGFVIPYYDYNSGNPIWKLKLENKNKVALANTQISVIVYYFRK